MVLHVTIFILYAPNVQNNSIYTNINPKNFIFLGLKSLDRLRGLFAPAHVRAGAVSGTECRRRSKGRGRRSEQRERGPFRALKMRPVRQELLLARHASENASRTTGGCPQSVESAVSRAFENASRTVGGRFRYRIFLPYRRRLFPVPNFSN